MHIPALTSNNTSSNTIKNKTTNFGNKGVEFLSDLANNSESLVPMMVKDVLSDSTLVLTYAKEGGKDDVREKAIEEFGTGAIWLYMIPAIKYLIDKGVPFLNKLDKFPIFKGVYHNLGLTPDFDPNLIINNKDIQDQATKKTKLESKNPFIKKIFNFFDDGINRKATKDVQDNILLNNNNPILADEKALFENLNEQNKVLKKFFKDKTPTNAQLYKGLKIGKFLIATTAAGIALVKVIEYKQKGTQERINKDFSQKSNASKVLINKTMNSDTIHQNFKSKINEQKKNNQLSFTGLDAFMTNPILNTLILDGVITSTRLAKARPGEKAEVGLKEAFQIIFTYGLAIPIQKAFEWAGDKINLPINLDPKVLFDKDLKSKLQGATEQIENIEQATKDNADNLISKIYETSADSELVDLLEKNGVLSTVEKNGKKAISYMTPIKESEVQDSFKDIKKLAENLNGNSKNLSKIKAFKVFSVVGNILIAMAVMGVIQPMTTIWMRKMMSGGGKENLAIKKLEQEQQKQTQQDA